MDRKIIYSLMAIMLGAGSTVAQTPQKLSLKQATVFIKGAELSSTAKVTLVKGENEFLFSNVAGNVNTQSIIASAGNGVIIESITFQNNYTATDNVSDKITAMKDSIELIDARRVPINNKIAMLNEQLTILQNNRKVGGENTGLSTAELLNLLEIVGSKMEGYMNQKAKAENNLRKINDQINNLSRQMQEEQQKSYQPGGQLLVKLYAKEPTTSDVTITYVTPNAGWSPTYDIWADDAKSPIRFSYKANVYQNSGVKWDNIRLTLSTGNPQEGMEAPVLSPWYLAFYTPPPPPAPTYVYNNTVVTQYKKPLVDKYRQSTLSSAEIKNQPTTQTTDLVAMAPGVYQSRRGAAINSDGGRGSGNLYIVDGVQVQGANGVDMAQGATETIQIVDVDNEGVNTTFDIELPYTIPSDGQQHLIAVKKYEAPATYEYFAVPKADKDAFLMARITKWQDLNLLPGPTNIFYENTYVGQGYIDTRTIKDTMSISLGRDKKIVIKKERDKNLRSVKMIGTNVRETYAYNITVRNTRKEPITLILNDQVPISNDKDIVVEDIATDGASKEEATGLLKWSLSLKANETKTLKFGYTVKYPKVKTLQ